MEPGSLTLGTYLGRADEATDDRYGEAIGAFLGAGGRAFDTAANYRGGRSERVLGKALAGAGEVFLSTKAGYLPMGDGTPGESAREWFRRVLEAPGILSGAEVVDGCHALTPRYLAHQLSVSQAALPGLPIDLFHLHNPEQQRPALGPKAFEEGLLRAFEACERFVSDGRIRAYGVATWNGFRVGPEAPEHLSLERLLALAAEVAGAAHHFRWVQLPLNLAMPEAFLAPTQGFSGTRMPLLEAARLAGVRVQTSAPLLQGKLCRDLPEGLQEALGGATPAQAALQFPRSCPGVDTVLCGMASAVHVGENAPVLELPRAEVDRLRGLFEA